MIELFAKQLRDAGRNSSKGNQLKWQSEGIWYKADCAGYEGLAEYTVSQLLKHSSLAKDEFVDYETIDIKYGNRIFHGAKSTDFLSSDWQIITLERLFWNQYGKSLYKTLWMMPDVEERFLFLCRAIEEITQLKNFGEYLTKLLVIDAFFKNEDRHMHNIAVLMNANGKYKLCPIFDNGAALLSDTQLDYSPEDDIYELMKTVKAKTISTDFDEQTDVAERRFPGTIRFFFGKKEVDAILDAEEHYSKEEKERVRTIIYEQMRKYEYLFSR